MRIVLAYGLTFIIGATLGAIIGGIYVYKSLLESSYAEIILENNSGRDIHSASVSYESYQIVIKDIPQGRQSPRVMYDTSKNTLNINFVLDVTFADGSTFHDTTLREVGSGEKVTVVIDREGAHTALRKADW
jgi:hypothetical protein